MKKRSTEGKVFQIKTAKELRAAYAVAERGDSIVVMPEMYRFRKPIVKRSHKNKPRSVLRRGGSKAKALAAALKTVRR